MAQSKFQTNLQGLQSSLLSFAMILTSNSRDAYDLVQDTTLNALDREQEYDGKVNFKNWVYTLMRNMYIANHRAIAVKEAADSELYSVTVVQPSVLEAPEGSVSCSELSRKMDAMEEIQRSVFTLHIKGYTVMEIADRLDMSAKEVRRTVRAALRQGA